MDPSSIDPGAPTKRHPRNLLRDPAVWVWLLVALLAVIPARVVLAGG